MTYVANGSFPSSVPADLNDLFAVLPWIFGILGFLLFVWLAVLVWRKWCRKNSTYARPVVGDGAMTRVVGQEQWWSVVATMYWTECLALWVRAASTLDPCDSGRTRKMYSC